MTNQGKWLRVCCMRGICLAMVLGLDAAAWRSKLYPLDWRPGQKDAEGRFLHDFSYAGYHRGEIPIPVVPPGPVVDVTRAPYHADPTGRKDATAAIQRAIDAVGVQGGGIVYLPEGMYRLAPRKGDRAALHIWESWTVVRGAGPEKTFLLNTSTDFRGRNIISVRPGAFSWRRPLTGTVRRLQNDVDAPAFVLPLNDSGGLQAGDWVVVTSDWTAEFIAEHGMEAWWTPSPRMLGPTFYRRIDAVDPAGHSVTLDAPTRYVLKTRDNARLYKVATPLTEVGLEGFSMGNLEHPGDGWGDGDFSRQGTAAYDVHGSHMVRMDHVLNGWIRDLRTFRPNSNRNDVHILSNGILLNRCRQVTVRDCVVEKPQYEGGGGNGYGYTLQSNDCLITHCEAVHTRHNYDFKTAAANGNVIHRSIGRVPRHSSDFHMFLSMANLFDCMLMDGDWLQGVFRPWGGPTNYHGHSTTQSVFWNTRGTARGRTPWVVESRQFGWGYIIGTSGEKTSVKRGVMDRHDVNTAPEDWLEGEGKGETLQPESLYEDQLRRRLARLPDVATGVLTDRITDTAAVIRAELRRTGGRPVRLTCYFGRLNGATAPQRWEQHRAANIGEHTGSHDMRLEGLQPGTEYWVRLLADNGRGRRWSPQSVRFRTSGTAPAQPLPLAVSVGADVARVRKENVDPAPVTAGLILRLVAESLSGRDDAVALDWPDVSGGTQTARWVGPPARFRPQGIGGRPSLHFDGQGALHIDDLKQELGAVHIFVVAAGEKTGTSDYQRIFASYSGTGEQWTPPNIDLQRPREADGTPRAFPPTLFVSTPDGERSLTRIVIGSKADSAYGFFSGDIAEVLVYERRLNDAEQQTLRTYLRTRYGLAAEEP